MQLCGCWSDCQLCLHATCCTSCRAGHTLHVAQIANYWLVVFAYTCCPCVVGPIWRCALRDRMGFHRDCFSDFFVHCCCWYCAVAQEAHEIDSATGVKVGCCCQLLNNGTVPTKPGVGPPIVPVVGAVVVQAAPVANVDAAPESNEKPNV